MYDVIVVGARCAGTMTARLLAQKGFRVLMVDAKENSASSPLANFIWLPGSRQLQKWGLFRRVQESGCPVIRSFTTDYGDFPLSSPPYPFEGQEEMLGPRRKFLDPLLLEAAEETGVEFWSGFRVENLIWEEDRVVGIQGRNCEGQNLQARARFVIGADGKNSLVAKQAKATLYRETPTQTVCYFGYFSGLPRDLLALGMQDRQAIFVFATHEGLSMVGALWRIEDWQEVRKDVEKHFYAGFQKYPWICEWITPESRKEGFYGHAEAPNFFRQAYGPGWALVGDAGYHRDPLSGYGLSDAFRDVELLAEAIDIFFSGKQEEAAALAAYEKARNEATAEMYEFILRSTRLNPGERLLQLRQAIRHQEEQCRKFHGIFSGTYSQRQFFSELKIEKPPRSK